MQASSRSQFQRTHRFVQENLTSPFRLSELDRKDTTILKALAILSIVLHNFFHIATKVHENEFDFDPARFGVFLNSVVHPSLATQTLFAFYGHFGVQIFIFLSAYGLAKAHWDDPSPWHSFMWSRVKKLYPMILLVVVFWASLVLIHFGSFWPLRDEGAEILLMLAGVSNIVPGLGLPPVGPWWFIPFIIQAYALFPLLRGLTRRFGWPALVVVSVLCYFITHLANPVLAPYSIIVATTPIARMRILCLGIIAARYPFRLRSYLAIPAFAVLILGSVYATWSHFASLASVIAGLWVYSKLRPILRESGALQKVGDYSLAIFLLNGIVRVPFVFFAHSPAMQLTLAGASAATTIAIAAFFHYVLAPASARKRTPVAATPALWSVEPASTGSD